MIIENVSTLKIQKLSQEQYNREQAAGNLDSHSIYLTPDEQITLEDIGAMSATNPTGTGSLSIGRKSGTTIGAKSVALGADATSSATCSFAAGEGVTASGNSSHAEGYYTWATGSASHAEGKNTTASGDYSHAEGYNTTASGNYSHAEGWNTTASEYYSHTEGNNTTASGFCSHAEGKNTTASGDYSNAKGWETTASGHSSHAEGNNTTASGNHSHAEGKNTTASGSCSHAEGTFTTALGYQHAQGHYNNTTSATVGVSYGTGSGTAFVIGNGLSSSASNAFRVTYDGQIYAKKSTILTGADYAEYFEWLDGNPTAEDRRGYFVTLDGDKIKIAQQNDYILGIISGQPSVIGNGDEDWMGRYVFDEFGAFVYEEFEYEVEEHENVVDEETGEIVSKTNTVIKTGKKYKENPDYDPTLQYIQRADRPEWDAVGMVGVLSVRDDGTCKVNGFCKVSEGGIATSSDSGYRVIKRVNDNIVKVVLK